MKSLTRYVLRRALRAHTPMPALVPTSTPVTYAERAKRMDNAQYLSSAATITFSLVSLADPLATFPLLASVVVLAITSALRLNIPDPPDTDT